MPLGVTQAVDIEKIKLWDKMTPLYTEGTFAGKEVSRAGRLAVSSIMYRDADRRHDLPRRARPNGRRSCRASTTPTRSASVPTSSAATITSWGDLLSTRLQGQDGDPEHPDHRHHGRHHGAASRPASVKYGDKGNPTQDELDQTIAQADRAEEGRPLARAVEHLRRVGEPDGVRRGGHPVDVVAGGDGGAGAGHQVRLPAAQGRLSRLGQRPGADGASRRHQARRGLRVPQLVQFRLGRRLHRQAGLLHLGARDGEGSISPRTSGASSTRARRRPPTSPARPARRPTAPAKSATAAPTRSASPRSACGTTSWTRPSSCTPSGTSSTPPDAPALHLITVAGAAQRAAPAPSMPRAALNRR